MCSRHFQLLRHPAFCGVLFSALLSGVIGLGACQPDRLENPSVFGAIPMPDSPPPPFLSDVQPGTLAVSGLIPTQGPNSGGPLLTLSGAGFVAGSSVQVGGVEAPEVIVWSGTKLSARLPALPGYWGPVPVRVQRPDGQTALVSEPFTYYAAPLRFPVPVLAEGTRDFVVVDDFDHDGKPDVLVSAVGGVELRRNRGDGTYESPRYYATGNQPRNALTGDWNGDGTIDVAVTSQVSSEVSVLLGDGRGDFTTIRNTPTAKPPRYLVGGDWNRDGKLDLAVSGLVTIGSLVQILLGDGLGGFSPAGSYSPAASLTGFAAADWNLDGKLDIAAGGSILLGDGAGGFVVTPAPTPFRDAVAGDWNQDQKPDLALVRGLGLANEAFLGDGAGGWLSGTSLGALSSNQVTSSLISLDINNDGMPDLASSTQFGVGMHLGDGQGGFSGASVSPLGGGIRSLRSGDANGDGRSDLFGILGSGVVRVLGNGTARLSGVSSVGSSGTAVAIADLDEDGLLDVLVAGEQMVSVSLGNGTAQPTATTSNFFPGQGILAIQVADLNGDRAQDAVVLGSVTGISVLLGDRTGRLTAGGGASLPTPCPCRLRIADWNNDGFSDLAVLNTGSGILTVLQGSGRGDFPSQRTFAIPGTLPTSLVVADVNQDGRLDLAAGQQDQIYVLLGDGRGDVSFTRSIPILGQAGALEAADLNRDGRIDLVYTDPAGSTGILLADTLGGFAPTQNFDSGSGSSCIAIANIDEDRHSDLIISRSSGLFGVFVGNGSGQFSATHTFAGSCPAIGDFTKDGRPDLVFANGQLHTNQGP